MKNATIEILVKVTPPRPMTLRALAHAFMTWITQDWTWATRGGFVIEAVGPNEKEEKSVIWVKL